MTLQKINIFFKDQINVTNNNREEDKSDEDKRDESKFPKWFDAILKDISYNDKTY